MNFRRQKEAEQKSIQEEANKRIEEMVSKRVEEELERRRDEIEAEVLRRVEEAKKVLEAQMLEEMEKRKQEQLEEAKRREVRVTCIPLVLYYFDHNNFLTIISNVMCNKLVNKNKAIQRICHHLMNIYKTLVCYLAHYLK